MKTLLTAVLLLISLPSFGVLHGDYVLTHETADGNKFCVQSSNYGYWCGYISTEAQEQEQSPLTEQVVSFVFFSPNYFRKDNRGHFAVGLRAHSVFPDGDVSRIEARGRGVIFGNATEYQGNAPGCGPTSTVNVVTFETWWHDGTAQKNCVMGWRESVQLENNTYYRITIRSTHNNGMYMSYVMEKYTELGQWTVIGRDSMFDFTPAAGNIDAGMFIAAVFGDHPWIFYIWGLTVEQK